MFRLTSFVCILLSEIVITEPSRILAMFPVPSISHQVVYRALTLELSKRGHELVIVTPDPAYLNAEASENIREIDVHGVSYNIWNRLFNLTASGEQNDLAQQIAAVHKIMLEVVLADLHNEELRNVMFGEDMFDLIFVESCCISTLSLSHVFKAPIIQVSSLSDTFGSHKIIGSPDQQLLYPTFERRRVYNLTLLEKFQELRIMNQHYNNHDYSVEEQRPAFEKYFGSDLTSFSKMKNYVEMLFLNSHPIWDDNRPVPPGVVYMGGLPQNPTKKLPEDLKSYLDSSLHGVIYVSFGTNMKPSMMSPEKIKMFLNIFSQLPYNIIWKWDKDELIGRPENVRIFKWLPQSDLLHHPKIRLFITQGGLQSIDEAILAGVPMIAIPFFADQWFNSEKIVHHNIGLKLDMPTLKEEQLMDAIQKIIQDESYRDNVSRFRSLLYDRQQKALERAVWWTEYVLRHGTAKHLRAPAANMPWTQYIELELVVLSLAFVFSIVLLISLAVYRLWRYISKKYLTVSSNI